MRFANVMYRKPRERVNRDRGAPGDRAAFERPSAFQAGDQAVIRPVLGPVLGPVTPLSKPVIGR